MTQIEHLIDVKLSKLRFYQILSNFLRSEIDHEIHKKKVEAVFNLFKQNEYITAFNYVNDIHKKGPRSITIRLLLSACMSLYNSHKDALLLSSNLLTKYKQSSFAIRVHLENLLRSGDIPGAMALLSACSDKEFKSSVKNLFQLLNQGTYSCKMLKDYIRMSEQINLNLNPFLAKFEVDLLNDRDALRIICTLPRETISEDEKYRLLLNSEVINANTKKFLQEIRRLSTSYHDEELNVKFGYGVSSYQCIEQAFIPGLRPSSYRCKRYFDNIEFSKDLSVVLDIGCNTGGLLHSISPRIKRGIGIDISATNIEVAKRTSKYLGNKNLTFYKTDALRHINSASEKFDLIICTAVHSWIGLSIHELCRHLLKLLKRGGHILIESQGISSTTRIEAGFETLKITNNLPLTVVSEDTIIDDRRNLRMYKILNYAKS